MKYNNRNIKRRLYQFTLIGNHLSRMKHFRGHGVHSPFVYGLVRNVFMSRKNEALPCSAFVSELINADVSQRRALQIEGAMTYCNATQYAIDNIDCNAEFCVLSLHTDTQNIEKAYNNAQTNGATLVVCQPYADGNRMQECLRLIDLHTSTSVDNRAYIIFFNNKLPKQHFRL